MTPPTDSSAPFDGLLTVREIDRRYKELFDKRNCVSDINAYWALHDEHRKAHDGLVVGRTAKPAPPDISDPNYVSGRAIRNWAMKNGIPLSRKGKVSKQIDRAYRVEHGLPVEEKPRKLTLDDAGATPDEIRTWARDHGIDCGIRGRVSADLIAMYVAAKEQ